MQENVSGFQPKADDLQYPEKLIAAQKASASREEAEDKSETPVRSDTADGAVNGTAGPSTNAEVIQTGCSWSAVLLLN